MIKTNPQVFICIFVPPFFRRLRPKSKLCQRIYHYFFVISLGCGFAVIATEGVSLCERMKSCGRFWNRNRPLVFCDAFLGKIVGPIGAYKAMPYTKVRPRLT